jgi:hypothetical protein
MRMRQPDAPELGAVVEVSVSVASSPYQLLREHRHWRWEPLGGTPRPVEAVMGDWELSALLDSPVKVVHVRDEPGPWVLWVWIVPGAGLASYRVGRLVPPWEG